MSLRRDYLFGRLDECFKETIAIDPNYPDSVDEHNFRPMLFMVNESWDIIGGPDEEVDYFDQLIRMGKTYVDMMKDSGVKVLPYVMSATSGEAVKIGEENIKIRSRLLSVYSDEFKFSKIDFSDGRKAFISEDIPDPDLEEMLEELLTYIKENH